MVFNLKIKKKESLQGHRAISGETYKITDETGKCYKLRECETLEKAKQIEKNVRKLPSAFPKFYGREGKNLLFEWIESEDFPRDPNEEICYQIGKLMGMAHELNEKSKGDPEEFFRKRILEIEKEIDPKIVEKIQKKFTELKKGVLLELVLEFNDVHPSNMVFDKKGRVYYVDEEGFDYKIKGIGFAKPLLIGKFVKTKKQKEAFWKGYREHHDDQFFDDKYQNLIKFLQLVRSLATKIRTGQEYKIKLNELLEML